MIRTLALCTAIAAAISFSTASAQPGPGAPSPGSGTPGGRPGGPPSLQDIIKSFPPVERIEKVADNLYVIPGQGGNTAVWVYSSGVLIVDSKFPGSGAKIRELVRTVTDRPITHIVNTHAHIDHTGSNAEFGPGVEIIAQESAAANMAKSALFQTPAMKAGLPNRIVKDRLTLFKGKDTVDILSLGPAHSSGDLVVIFRSARVMDAGDLLKDKAGPTVDSTTGGSGINFPVALARATRIKGVDRIITGHGAQVLPRAELLRVSELSRLLLDHERAMFAAGKTPKETLDSFNPPARYKDIPISGFAFGGLQEVEATFNELRATSPGK